MAYNDTKKTNGTNSGFKKKNNRFNDKEAPKKPRKESFTFEIVPTFIAPIHQGETVEIDHDTVIERLGFLEDQGVFEILTQNVSIANSLLYDDPEKKGNSTIGFINEVNVDENKVDMTVFGTSVEKIKSLMEKCTLTFEPRIIHRNGEFRTFNGFSLVKA